MRHVRLFTHLRFTVFNFNVSFGFNALFNFSMFMTCLHLCVGCNSNQAHPDVRRMCCKSGLLHEALSALCKICIARQRTFSKLFVKPDHCID